MNTTLLVEVEFSLRIIVVRSLPVELRIAQDFHKKGKKNHYFQYIFGFKTKIYMRVLKIKRKIYQLYQKKLKYFSKLNIFHLYSFVSRASQHVGKFEHMPRISIGVFRSGSISHFKGT